MLLFAIQKIPALRKWYFNSGGHALTEKKIQFFLPFIKENSNILDIGSGGGLLTYLLRQKNFNVTPLDIIKGNYHPETEPIVYDGIQMPFENASFDYGLLLTVLHHIKNHEEVLKESARVCKRLVIIEDVYSNVLQEYATKTTDSIVNFGYSPCPHTNHTDAEWRSIFHKNNLTIEHVQFRNVLGVFRQVMYVLKT